MDVDSITIEERKKHVQNGACFTCGETGHFSAKCPNREKKKFDRKQKGKKDERGRKKMTPNALRTHIRSLIVENLDNEDEIEQFLETMEDEGF